MHSYLVVAAKPGRHIPAHVLDLLGSAAPADLAFVPDDHVLWTAEGGRLAYGGWQGFTTFAGIGSHWHASDRGVTAFSGRMWPHGGMWSSATSWAHQLDERWRSAPVDKYGQPFDGVFTAVSLSPDGTGEIVSDPLGIAMIYRAESDDLVAYATRPGLAAQAVVKLGEDPERDPSAVGWLVFSGNLCGDRTGYTRVRVLPIGSYVELHPRFGSRVRTANPTPWVNERGLPERPDELIELVHEDLLRRVKSVAMLSGPARPRVDITGGRDSRLILALLVEAQVTDRFRFSTIGADGAPDAVVGRELAEMLSLDFEPEPPRPLAPEDFLLRLQIHAFQTSGMCNAWDLQGGTGVQSTVTVSGLFGEVLRTHFSGYPSLGSSEELLNLYLRPGLVDPLELLRPEMRAHYRQFVVEDLVERNDCESGLPFDRLDVFHIRNRQRRWSGTIEETGQAGRVFPLYSLLALQAGFIVGPERRHNDYLNFHVMRAACPMLAEHRFANRGWDESLLADLTDADRYRSEPFVPTADSPREWQADRFEQHRDLIQAYLLNDLDSPLYEVMDRPATLRALEGELAPGFQARYQVFGALAAAVWLGHHEAPIRAGTPRAQHPPPAEPPAPGVAASPTTLDEPVVDVQPTTTAPDAPTPIHRVPSVIRKALRPIRRAARPIRRAARSIRQRRAPS